MAVWFVTRRSETQIAAGWLRVNRLFGIMAACADPFAARAKVAELVDALALGASGATRESSSLSFRTRVRAG